MKQGVVKIKCKCQNKGQDALYGEGVRVANTTAKQDKDYVDVRCTVCKAIQRVNPGQVR